MPFAIWLLSLTRMHFGFTHLVMFIPFYCWALWHYMDVHSLFIHSLVEGHLRFSSVFSYSKCSWIEFYIFIVLGQIPGTRVAGSRGKYRFTYRKLINFSKVIVSYKSPSYFPSPTILDIVVFLKPFFNRCVLLSNYGFNSHFLSDQCYWTCDHGFIYWNISSNFFHFLTLVFSYD